MEAYSSKNNFYKMILKDCYLILLKYSSESIKKEIPDALDKLITNCKNILSILSVPKNDFIYESSSNYLWALELLKNSISQNVDEYDIYEAYAFLWQISYLTQNSELDEISTFENNSFENFTLFLDKYGHSKMIKKIIIKILKLFEIQMKTKN